MGIDYIGIFRISKWTSLMWFFQNFLFVKALPHDVNWSRSLLSWKRYSVQIWKWNINKSKIQLGCGVTISRVKRFLDNVIGQDHQQLESWTIWWNSYSFLSILRHQAILFVCAIFKNIELYPNSLLQAPHWKFWLTSGICGFDFSTFRT